MSSTLVHCYNKGCGQKFDPSNNSEESCIYHPGPPYFHDAQKIWKCCNKKSTDFSTWLSYKGCTKGFHNPEKPVEAVKQATKTEEIKSEKTENVVVWNGLNKPAERQQIDFSNDKFIKLKNKVNENVLNAINSHKKLLSTSNENDTGQILIGTICKNPSCKETFSGTDSDLNKTCCYHPGTAVFHEGMKYWSCCQKKTSDFSAFLEQAGCEIGSHCWSKVEKDTKLREDWFSQNGYIHINIYCKNALPDRCNFESNGLVINALLVYKFGDKESSLNYELWGRISPNESWVEYSECKVELVLKQVDNKGWPKLLYEKKDEK